MTDDDDDAVDVEVAKGVTIQVCGGCDKVHITFFDFSDEPFATIALDEPEATAFAQRMTQLVLEVRTKQTEVPNGRHKLH